MGNVYAERFPQRRIPNKKTILGVVVQRLRTTGSVLPKHQDLDRGRNAEMVNVEEEILHRVDEDSSVSTTQIRGRFTKLCKFTIR
jgi:hypothetical protein